MSWYMIDELDELDDVSTDHYGPCCETGECDSDSAPTDPEEGDNSRPLRPQPTDP